MRNPERRKAGDNTQPADIHQFVNSTGSAYAIKPYSKRVLHGCLTALLGTFLFLITPLLLIAIIEGGLRGIGYGQSTRFLIRKEFSGHRFYASNPAFFQQFFTIPLTRGFEVVEIQVPQRKQANTYRIFVLGGSAAQGAPPDNAFSFARILEVMLRSRFPDVKFEVYNAAFYGISSHVVRLVAKECARLEADLLIVYSGNNEVNGPFGAATAEGKTWTRSLPFIRTTIFISNMRIVQMAMRRWEGLRPIFVEPTNHYLPPESPRMMRVNAHYEANLNDICAFGTKHGAHVILCTVACNIKDWAPTHSEHREGLSESEENSWKKHYEEGCVAQKRGDFHTAIMCYRQAAAIDETYADLLFRLGECYLRIGAFEQARAHFFQARDWDMLHCRITGDMNGIVAKVARRWAGREVHFADVAQHLAKNSVHNLPGWEMFYDNVHMTFSGNYLVASMLFGRIVDLLPARILPDDSTAQACLSQEECERRLGLSPAVLLSHYDRILQINDAFWHRDMGFIVERKQEILQQFGSRLPEVAAEGYAEALRINAPDFFLRSRYAQALMELDRISEALEQAELLAQEFPLRCDAHRILGMTLAKADNPEMAIKSFENILKMNPSDAQTHAQIADAVDTIGRADTALEMYRKSLAIDPENAEVICKEANLLDRLQNTEKAMGRLLDALRIDSNYFPAYDKLNEIFRREITSKEQVQKWKNIVNEHPESVPAHFYLGLALQDAGDTDGAIKVYQDALSIRPMNTVLLSGLADALVLQGDFAAALNALAAAVETSPRDVAIRAKLITVLTRIGDFDAAREQVRLCENLGLKIPAEILQDLDFVSISENRDSGPD
ncbi:MAG TPA: tetratricopeptide repeat protein [Candidatus Hydrogenedentes bacterium]|nr:tetratricopeptide repeat protein [Candidatus Hydrogenedentota bacterium]